MADRQWTNNLTSPEIFNVKGYKCVVTGGATGIGLMITQGLVRNGAKVYITGRRKEVLDVAVRAYSSPETGGEVVAIPCDITDKEQVSSLAQHLEKIEPDGINLLVNNAGIVPESDTLTTGPEDRSDSEMVKEWLWKSTPDLWHQTMNTNVTGQYFTTIALLPLLAKAKESRKGHSPSVINITSIAGVMKGSGKGWFAYCASKAAMIHLSRQLGNTFAPLGVRVNSIAPGLFPSEITAREPADKETGKNSLPQIERNWQAGRPGDEGDIAGTVLYLASPAGAFHNGHTIYLDGGFTLTSPSAV